MDEIPLSIQFDGNSRLNINLSEEQMKDLAQQVAKILAEKANG